MDCVRLVISSVKLLSFAHLCYDDWQLIQKEVSESVFEATVKGGRKMKETDISANQFFREKNSKAEEKRCLHH